VTKFKFFFREEKQIEYGWENPKEERMSFKDVEGQGRDDNSGKRKKELKKFPKRKKSVTKFKFFFSFPRVIIPPLPLHIFKTHSLLLSIVNMDVCVYNEVFKQ
jgi:hypothetical protein